MNYFLLVFLFFAPLSFYAQKESTLNKFKMIIEEIGDLDNDGIDEKIVIYEINEVTNYRKLRELWIFKNENGKWINWIKTNDAILASNEGGPMGDPLEGIEIENNLLRIHFYGGSNWKWTYTDTYKFQNNQFELIGYTHTNFKLCDDWDSLDFNLSTGKIVLKNGFENCEKKVQKRHTEETEIFYTKDLLITLQNRNDKEIKIVSPKGKITYLFQKH